MLHFLCRIAQDLVFCYAIRRGKKNMLKIGIDIVEVSRAKGLYEAYGQKLCRFLSPQEMVFIHSSQNSSKALAILMAIKEAVFKALEISWFGLTGWKKIQVHSQGKAFKVRLSGNLKEYVLKEDMMWINVASTKKFVLARVLIEQGRQED